jgi:hypothetical protein
VTKTHLGVTKRVIAETNNDMESVWTWLWLPFGDLAARLALVAESCRIEWNIRRQVRQFRSLKKSGRVSKHLPVPRLGPFAGVREGSIVHALSRIGQIIAKANKSVSARNVSLPVSD